jgi:hypothetical protein
MENKSRPQIENEYNERWLPVVIQIQTRSLTVPGKPRLSFEKKAAGEELSDYADIAGQYSIEDDGFIGSDSYEREAVEVSLEAFEEDLEDLTKEEKELKTSSLFIQVQEMSVSKKIEFAMKCNKEARTILIRDSNRLVQMSVIRSPKITDSEIVTIANNRSVNEDVLKYISTQREWMKNYEVRVALVFNPKTPIFISTKIVYSLKERELSKLGKSKSVPRILSLTAVRRLHEVKR